MFEPLYKPEESRGIWVYLEQQGGKMEGVSLELLGKARELADEAKIPLAGGQYFWNVRVWDADSGTNELDTPFNYPMVINDEGKATGAMCLEHGWSFESLTSSSTGDDEPGAAASRLEKCGSRT